jgi:hypothetical protein
MSTRLDKINADKGSLRTGHEGQNVAVDEFIPSCSIEDVDRSLFNLFNKDIPLFFEFENNMNRIPVIFATGERFAVLRRKKPLRDKSGALILPLVSIMRTDINQTPDTGMGPGQLGPSIIKKRLSKDDPKYQRLLNNRALKSQDSANHPSHLADGDGQGTANGTLGARRNTPRPDEDTRSGMHIKAKLGANIFEIIEMPPVKFYTTNYEVTFWAQYTQQINHMLAAMLSTYHNNHARQFRIETEKGYWFVATVDSTITPGTNYDDFTDEERLVKLSFNIKVPGYLIAPNYPGSSNVLRKYVSAPETAFASTQTSGIPVNPIQGGVASSDVNAYILNDFALADEPLPGQAIGADGVASSLRIAGVDQTGASVAAVDNRPSSMKSKRGTAPPEKVEASLGGYAASGGAQQMLRISHDPFTGKKITKIVRVKSRNQRKGETVYREGLTKDLGEI